MNWYLAIGAVLAFLLFMIFIIWINRRVEKAMEKEKQTKKKIPHLY